MPFNSTPDLPEDPSVRIFFSGLLILEPSDDRKSCEVFVHRSAPNHHLTIEVRRKRWRKPDEILMRHIGPLAFADDAPRHGMFIAVTGAQGVKAFRPGNASTEGESFDLAINLENSPFHNAPVGEVDPLGGLPSILLNDGVLYTADTTRPELEINLRRAAGKNGGGAEAEGELVQALPPFASLIGANLYLSDDQLLGIRWRQHGHDEALQLPKPPEGTSYEVYIVNDPLYESDDEGLPAHDEFREYYKILPEVQTHQQFRLEVKKKQPEDVVERGSTRTPCMPVTKG